MSARRECIASFAPLAVVGREEEGDVMKFVVVAIMVAVVEKVVEAAAERAPDRRRLACHRNPCTSFFASTTRRTNPSSL